MDSKETIRKILVCRDDCWNIKSEDNAKEAYAICLKEEDKAIGAIELKLNGHTDMTDRKDECELGYWLGKPFWGQGIMPEAVKEMLRHAFEDSGITRIPQNRRTNDQIYRNC